MKRYQFFFNESKPFVKLMMLICIFMVFTSLASFVLMLFPLEPIYKQALSQIIMFGLATMLWGLMFEGSVFGFMNLKNRGLAHYSIIAILLIIVVAPFIDGIGLWNDSWHFSSEQVFRQMEKEARNIMEAFTKDTSSKGLALNIIVLAFLPAVLEEYFFRAAMQTTMINLLRNRFLAILISSIIFSLIHFQLFSSVPRVFLGLFLGYLYEFSKNILIPILFHFLNNLVVIMGYYLLNTNQISIDISQLGSLYNPYLFSISIILILGWFVFELRKEKIRIKS